MPPAIIRDLEIRMSQTDQNKENEYVKRKIFYFPWLLVRRLPGVYCRTGSLCPAWSHLQYNNHVSLHKKTVLKFEIKYSFFVLIIDSVRVQVIKEAGEKYRELTNEIVRSKEIPVVQLYSQH